MHRPRSLIAAVLLLAACGRAEAAVPLPAPAGESVATDAIDIAARLDTPAAEGVPDVVGQPVGEARARLAEAGLHPQFLAFGAQLRVSAQYPTAGQPPSAGGHVVVWLGAPPAPPPPAPPAAATGAAKVTAIEEREPAPDPASDPVPTPAPTPEPAPVATPSIRELPPAPAGETLTGPASWYGPGFAGRTTACGDVFDPSALTLASRELPCGAGVRVTGPTGATVEAIVSDWGPAEWTGRRFDLSQATFAAIHPLSAGVIDVTVEVLE